MKSQEEAAALAGVDLSHLTEEEIKVPQKFFENFWRIFFSNFFVLDYYECDYAGESG